MSVLRCYEFTPAQAARFADYLAIGNQNIWFELYDQQCRADELRAERVRHDVAVGNRVPDTPFNRRALGMPLQ